MKKLLIIGFAVIACISLVIVPFSANNSFEAAFTKTVEVLDRFGSSCKQMISVFVNGSEYDYPDDWYSVMLCEDDGDCFGWLYVHSSFVENESGNKNKTIYIDDWKLVVYSGYEQYVDEWRVIVDKLYSVEYHKKWYRFEYTSYLVSSDGEVLCSDLRLYPLNDGRYNEFSSVGSKEILIK